MAHTTTMAEPSRKGAAPPTVRVWDLFIRIFHWSLALCFATAFATGDELESLHEWAGYAVLGLIALRIIWGFIGPKNARFASFLRPPREALAYLKGLFQGRVPHYHGHDPAGGLMILALLAALITTAVTGIMLDGSGWFSQASLEGVHELSANLTVALVLVHIAGVVVSSLFENENLIRAMITGRKKAQASRAEQSE